MASGNRYKTTSNEISTLAQRNVAEKGIAITPSSLSMRKENSKTGGQQQASLQKYSNFISRRKNNDDETDRMAANRKRISDWSTNKAPCGENDFDMKRHEKPEATGLDVSNLSLFDATDVPTTSTENLLKEISANDKVSARFLVNMEKIIGKKSGVKVFFPSCVKLFEMTWLIKKGHTVIAVESNETIILKFFDMAKIRPITDYVPSSTVKLFKTLDGRIRIYNTDFCKFSPQCEPDVDVIWDNDSVRSAIRSNKKRFIATINSLMRSGTNYFLAIKEGVRSNKSQLPKELRIFQEQMVGGIQIQMIDTIIETAGEGDNISGERKTHLYILSKV